MLVIDADCKLLSSLLYLRYICIRQYLFPDQGRSKG